MLQDESAYPPLKVEPTGELPLKGRLLAVDYGHRRLGIAVTNDEQSIASPLENYTRRSARLDAAYLQRLAKEYRIVGCVVGLPLHMGGSVSESSHKAQKFASWFMELTGLPVAFHDERCSSAVVEDRLIELDVSRQKRKQILDKLAAQVILQAFLQKRAPAPCPAPLVEPETSADDVAE